MLNREVFFKDPTQTTIPNDGVAEVTEPETPAQWDVLKYELESFVCDGAYREGLERILSTYVRNLGEPKQPAVWVSGFYGSGKSHLVRVLEFLWRDVKLPNGATARSLAKLPTEINDLFHELSTFGKREGGLWSVAGRLGSGSPDSVRLALAGIVFRSAGLPEEYPAARFVLWLHKNGLYDAVKADVEAQGQTLESELCDLYVSPILASSILKAHPTFAQSHAQAHDLLMAQFPQVSDITEEQMIAILTDVFQRQSTTPGKTPCVLIVLDEMQQYLGDNNERIQQVGLAVEVCSSRFGSRLLFVATGQLALVASPQITRLQDRFTVPVELSDTDVEKVIREVVLRKSTAATLDVQKVLENASGEIDRHLAGTKIGPMTEDKTVWVADYPLLPVRRRFWEKVLRAVDRAGRAGQLRTQLKVVHEAVRDIAEEPLGTVVAGDRIYAQISNSMLQTGVLLRDVHEMIVKQNDGTPDGILRSRLLATIFLINQVTGADPNTGIKATAETLADLLIEDVKMGGAALRQRIPDVLKELAGTGSLMLISDEYRLQTKESAEWEQGYQGHYQHILNDDARIAADRATELRNACKKTLTDLTFTHGNSKTPRKAEVYFSNDEPKTDTGAIPVWIRDDWTASDTQVRQDAQAGGSESPLVYVYLPRRSADDLKKALAGYAAAQATLNRPTPTTPGGLEAKRGMETRRDVMRGEIDTLIADILKDARVYQGGGSEVNATDLNAAVKSATQASLARFYPQFAMGDEPRWSLVIQRVKQGNTDPLSALGYQGNTNEHPVCQKMLTEIGASGKKGSDLRNTFTGTKFGWPKDTVDGAVLSLLAAGHIKALQNGVQVPLAQVDQAKLGTIEFRSEVAVVTTKQRVEVRGLLQSAGVPFQQGSEALAVPRLLDTMKALAESAGGAAPLPSVPDTSHLDDLMKLTGNEFLVAVYEQKDRLSKEITAWKAAKMKAETRLKRWERLETLLKQAKTLPEYAQASAQTEGIKTNRSLLADPDPVPTLCRDLTNVLRDAITEARKKHLEAYTEQLGVFETDTNWLQMEEKTQKEIRAQNGLEPLAELKVKTEDEVLATLEETPLAEWDSRTAALAERISRCLLEAAKLLEPKSVRVTLPKASINTTEELDAYLEKVRVEVMAYLAAGQPVVL